MLVAQGETSTKELHDMFMDMAMLVESQVKTRKTNISQRLMDLLKKIGVPML